MTREHLGWLIWGGLALLVLAFELPAVGRHMPWPTLSETLWGLQQRWPWITAPLVAGLALLSVHLTRLRNVQQKRGPSKEDT